MANREIIRVATPVTLARLGRILGAYDGDVDMEDAIVRHHNGHLLVEVPTPTFPEAGDDGTWTRIDAFATGRVVGVPGIAPGVGLPGAQDVKDALAEAAAELPNGADE